MTKIELEKLILKKLTSYSLNLSESDSDYDSELEELTTNYDSEPEESEKRKPDEVKEILKADEEILKTAFGHLVENNIHNLSKDIYDGIEDMFLYMDKYFINPKTADLTLFMKDKKLHIDEYNLNVENIINYLFSEIPNYLKPKLNQLREILLKKYINKDTIETVKPICKDDEYLYKSIIN